MRPHAIVRLIVSRSLLVAALLSLGIGFIHNEFAEAIGIFCAIFLATGVAFWFEYDAMKKFDVLNSTGKSVFSRMACPIFEK